jgi:hypothetical protein
MRVYTVNLKETLTLNIQMRNHFNGARRSHKK